MNSSEQSAAAIVPEVVDMLCPKTVADFGGGAGHWAEAFYRHKAFCWNFDLESVSQVKTIDDLNWFEPFDLTKPVPVPDRVDLALCLEVADQLPPSAAKTLVQSLVDAADVVMFSAAVPGQGGHHLNARPPEYWDGLFQRHGYVPVRGWFDPFVGREDVAWWYALNGVFYVKEGSEKRQTIEAAAAQRAFKPVPTSNILPVVMTCGKSLDYVRRFARSATVSMCALYDFPSPVVCIDLTSGDRLTSAYLDELNWLKPRAYHVHAKVPGVTPYDSIQDAAWFALSAGLSELVGDEDWLLFLEDDIEFSSQFMEWFECTGLNPHAGFYSLYQPGDEYGSEVIDPNRFYGTQCVLFPKASVELLLAERTEAEKHPPGYDIRWSRHLSCRGKRLYASDRSYVQHIGVNSRLGCAGHQSKRFVP